MNRFFHLTRPRLSWHLVFSIVCLAHAMLPRRAVAQPTQPATSTQRVVDANNAFAFDIYQKLSAEPARVGKNLVFSPYSISTALSMVLEGARGATEEQLARVACPIGLDIQSQSVPEIAVSILAQLIQKRAEILTAV